MRDANDWTAHLNTAPSTLAHRSLTAVARDRLARPALVFVRIWAGQASAGIAQEGEAVNTLFEERLFDVVNVLQSIAETLTAGDIPCEAIGGLAVLIHVEEASPEHSSLTRDVDLLVRRSDLGRIQEVAAKSGFRFRHAAGVDMLIYSDSGSIQDAVHLIFSEEKVRPNDPLSSPAIAQERKQINGKEVLVIPVADLLQMKLTSFRLTDQVQIQSMEARQL